MSIKNLSIENTITDAAEILLAEVGMSFTMAQLEARANISRATIYRRIGNKESLLEQLAVARGETFEKADIRQTILKAARIVFGQNGLINTTIELIAKEADVGVATVYRHFGDKESLIYAFIEEMTPRNRALSIVSEPTANLQADLEQFVTMLVAFFYENRDLMRLILMGGEQERRYLEQMRQGSDSTLHSLTQYFESQQTAGRINSLAAPNELALMLLGLILAHAVIGPLHYKTNLKNPTHISRLIVSLFLNGL